MRRWTILALGGAFLAAAPAAAGSRVIDLRPYTELEPNLTALAVHPETGHLLVGSNTGNDAPNLWTFTLDGGLVASTRAAGTEGTHLNSIELKDTMRLFGVTTSGVYPSLQHELLELSADGTTLYSTVDITSIFEGSAPEAPRDPGQETIFVTSYAAHEVHELGLDGVLLDTFEVKSSPRDVVYDPATLTLFVIYGEERRTFLDEYRRDGAGELVYSFTHDMSTIGITDPLAISISPITGLLYVENQATIVELDLEALEPSPLDVIVDNGDPGTSSTGHWYVSGAPFPWGADSLYSREAGAEYVYQVPLLEAGVYEVFIWYTAYPSRVRSVPVSIEHVAGTAILHLDQTQPATFPSPSWGTLGRFEFGDSATMRIRSLGGGSTCADAVKLVRIGDPPLAPATFIVDDGDPGTGAVGSWSVSGAVNPWGGRSLYSREAGAKYTFRLAVPVAGAHEVQVWWTQYPSRRSDVPIAIQHAAGTSTVQVDQLTGGGQWTSLGTHDFAGEAVVTIHSLGGGSTCADAVKLIRSTGAGPPPVPTIIDNGDPGTSFRGSWAASGGANPWGPGSLYAKQAGAYYLYETRLIPGTYQVFLWWTSYPSRITAVPVWIRGLGSSRSLVHVNQRSDGGRWSSLGVFEIGEYGEVQIVASDGGSTCADAVKFVPYMPAP